MYDFPMGRRYLILIGSLFFYLAVIRAGEQAFGLDEKPGAYLPDSVWVINEDSVPVLLNELITRPTLLSFVYYHCPALCPKMMEGIKSA